MRKPRSSALVSSALGLTVVVSLLLTQCSSGPGGIPDGPGMLYFYAVWWEICQAMEPIVDELEDEYKGDFDIVRIDIDTNRGKDLAREHAFVGQPTFILFNDAGEEVRRLQGPQAKETLEREINRVLGR